MILPSAGPDPAPGTFEPNSKFTHKAALSLGKRFPSWTPSPVEVRGSPAHFILGAPVLASGAHPGIWGLPDALWNLVKLWELPCGASSPLFGPICLPFSSEGLSKRVVGRAPVLIHQRALCSSTRSHPSPGGPHHLYGAGNPKGT